MPDASRSRPELVRAFAALDLEQRAAAVGAILLAVSTLGPFSFVEAAVLLVAASVLLLLKKRADGASFHLPFGDGTVIAAAGAWSAVLILVRILDRSLGQELLALACAAILVVAGVRQRARRPADDVATAPADPPREAATARGKRPADDRPTRPRRARRPAPPPGEAPTQRLEDHAPDRPERP